MKFYLLYGLVATSFALPTPQKPFPDLGDIKEIFRSSSSANENQNNISPEASARTIPEHPEPTSRSGVDVLVQVLESDKRVKSESSLDNYSDYGEDLRVDESGLSCSAFSSEGYSCVAYYQCRNGSIITDGSGLIDVRNAFATLDVETSKCPGFLDVCCKDPDFNPPPPPPPAPYSPKCGRRNVDGLGARIQGFRQGEAQFGEWPHMCAVLRHDIVGEHEIDLYQCGGSLVGPGIILTAAHCVERYRNQATRLKVRCGEWNTQNDTEPLPHQDRDVAAVNVHPEYFGGALFNDVALLFTKEEFVLSQHIDTACLPQPEESFATETCFATGWGKNKFGSSGEYQVVLKEVDIPVVERESCQESLRNTRLGKLFKLDESFLCAGGEAGKDTCRGDGGSPLVCPSKYDSSSYVQAGVVAWGIGCGEDGTPGVYADVSKAVCWMDYAASCYYGLPNSYWGYYSDSCGKWKDGKVTDLKKKVEQVKGRAGKIFQYQLNQYQECDVTWNSKVDVSAFGRDIDNAGGGFDIKNKGSESESTEATTAVTDESLVERTTESDSIFDNEDLHANTEQPKSEVKAIISELGRSSIEKDVYTGESETTTKNGVEVSETTTKNGVEESETTTKNGVEVSEEYSTVKHFVQPEPRSLERSNDIYRK